MIQLLHLPSYAIQQCVDMRHPEITKPLKITEFETEERCSIIELANDPADPEVSVAQARVKPGVTTAWHMLNGINERYIILSGKGRVELGDLASVEVDAGDVVRIPEKTRQRITNIGDADLIFYAICTPRFEKHLYISLE
jgi:mannose-6-phosphate isomerase-like protein (cupin superfamily)